MKRIIIKVLTVLTLSVTVLALLAACTSDKKDGTVLSGKYSNLDSGTGVTFEFSDDMTVKVSRQSTYRSDLEAKGTYSISDGKITITFTERTVGSSETAEKYSGELSFESGDVYIRIGGTEYKKI